MESVSALGHRKIAQHKHFSATLVLHTFRAIEGAFARIQNVVEASELRRFGEGGFSLVPDFVGTHALFRAGGELHHDIVETEVVVDLTSLASAAATRLCQNSEAQAFCRDTRLARFSFTRAQKSAPSHIGLLGVPTHICVVGLYFMGCPAHSVPAQPHKTAPQRRPKGSLSLTQMLRSSFSEFIILQHNKEYSIALFL